MTVILFKNNMLAHIFKKIYMSCGCKMCKFETSPQTGLLVITGYATVVVCNLCHVFTKAVFSFLQNMG